MSTKPTGPLANSNREGLNAVMPTILRHEGVWEGVYRYVDREGGLLDQHDTHITCEFPDQGPFHYIQHNHFMWRDGRENRAVLPGVLRNNRIWWDTPTFSGCAWEAGDGILLLNLARKDELGARFFEMIAMDESEQHRSRTWQWFKGGKLFKRTLCDEWRVG